MTTSYGSHCDMFLCYTDQWDFARHRIQCMYDHSLYVWPSGGVAGLIRLPANIV